VLAGTSRRSKLLANFVQAGDEPLIDRRQGLNAFIDGLLGQARRVFVFAIDDALRHCFNQMILAYFGTEIR
jgi:hypothetical protein